MKTLINEKVTMSADGKSVTITCDVVDRPFNEMLITRVSHGHANPENMLHPRRIQSSSAAVFLEAPGCKVCIPNNFIANIFAVIEPRTSFAPVFKKNEDGSTAVVSETPVKFQWQVSDDAFPESTYPPPPAVWSDLSGQTAASLDESSVKVGQWVRCVATNLSGSFTTKPRQINAVKK